jgi:hypothetical protein
MGSSAFTMGIPATIPAGEYVPAADQRVVIALQAVRAFRDALRPPR